MPATSPSAAGSACCRASLRPVDQRRDRCGEPAVAVGLGRAARCERIRCPAFASTARWRSIRCGKSTLNAMRRHIGALRHEAHVAERAGFDDLGVILLVTPSTSPVGPLSIRSNRRGKGVAQIEAAPAAVTDVEDALASLRRASARRRNRGLATRSADASAHRGCLRAWRYSRR